MSDAAINRRSGAAPARTTAQDHSEEVQRFRWFILAGLITAAIMEVLDTTIVNVALPQMAGNLGATNQEIGWVSTGYILSNVVVLPMTAFFAQRFGRRNYLTFSIFLFIVSSFFCGTSHTLVELVFWRISQGAGGAALLSTAQATIRQIFPREQQGMVQAIFLLGIIVAPTLGPTLGGWITDNYTWNWCFFINVPIGIASAFLVTNYLHDPPGMRKVVDVDYIGIGLLAVGLGCLQYVLEEGQQNDWFQDATILRLAVVSGACLIAMMWWELSPRNKHPVVDFRVLRNGQLSASIALFVALGFGLYGGVYLFPLFTQTILGFTPTETGLALLPGGIATALAALICGRLLNGAKALIDPRILIYIGIGIFAISMWQLGHMTTASGEPDTRLALIIRGFGLGCLFTPLNQIAYGSVKPQEAQQASGLINLSRQLGGSFGIAILGTFIVNHTAYHRADLVTHLNAGNPAVSQWLQGAQGNLVAHGYSPAQAQQAAYGLLDGDVMRQALTMSYNDGFLLILLIFGACLPAILILRRPKPAPIPQDAH
jgi:DHA2 family multidrug resistance protein